jgi:hypothetical protein
VISFSSVFTPKHNRMLNLRLAPYGMPIVSSMAMRGRERSI